MVPLLVHPERALSPKASASDITEAVAALQLKVEDVAEKAGVHSTGRDLEATLEALPPSRRRRLTVLLDAVRFNAELHENSAMAFAAGYVLSLARDVWGWRETRPASSGFGSARA